jgi:hypothetical protein
MSRYTVTRSAATVILAVVFGVVFSLMVAIPIAGIPPMTVAFAGMLLAGVGILLRRRVLVRVER